MPRAAVVAGSPSSSDAIVTGEASGGFFALFDLPERFDIDVDELERRYLARSKEAHPDRFVNADASERVAALQATMALNEAYKALKKPVSRAEYLLVRHGGSIGDNEQLDPAFLMDVLEAREELQGVKAAGDHAELRRLEDAMLDRHDAALARVGELFGQLEAGAAPRAAELLGEIKNQLIRLRYIARYLEQFDLDDEEP